MSETGADVSVVSGYPGNLYALTLSWNNLTVGDRIVIYDSATNDATKPKLWEFLIPTTAGSISPAFPAVGKAFGAGIYVNPNLSAITNDKFKLELSYDGM